MARKYATADTVAADELHDFIRPRHQMVLTTFRADGSLPSSHLPEAHQEYLSEGTPLRPSGAVDIRAAVWLPDEEPR